MNTPSRKQVAGIALSASALVSLIVSESYSDKAIIPVKGDVPTIGFGTTDGVKLGDTTTPPKALMRTLQDVQKFEGALKTCVTAPLSQNEYDAYIELSYNIGSYAFCNSTLVKKLNTYDYEGACAEIKKWDKFKGKSLNGLTLRRAREYQLCMTP
jgi:lysozyme